MRSLVVNVEHEAATDFQNLDRERELMQELSAAIFKGMKQVRLPRPSSLRSFRCPLHRVSDAPSADQSQ